MELKKREAKAWKPYLFFQAKLYPTLPYLSYKALQVKKKYPTPPAMSNELILGESDQKILIIGESTVAGVGAQDPTETLAYHIHSFFEGKYEVQNYGKNGIRAKELLPYFRKNLKSINGQVDGIFLYIGANDCFKLTSPTDYYKALKHVLEVLQEQFKANWIYLADIPPVEQFPAFPPILKSFLKEQRHFLKTQMEMLSRENEQVIHEQISMDFDPSFFSNDLVHPSGKGYLEIAKFSFSGLQRAGVV